MQPSPPVERNILQGWFDWLPLWLGLGIAIYDLLPFEPSRLAAAGLPPLAFAAFCLRRHLGGLRIVLAIMAVLLGFSCAEWQTARVMHPILKTPFAGFVEGRIEDVVPVGKRFGVTLDAVRLEGIAEAETPPRIHLTLSQGDAELPVGARVWFRAHLSAPARPVMPGAFDFGRYFFFRGIGAIGYALPPVTILPPTTDTDWRNEADLRMAKLRFAVKRYYLDQLPGEAGRVAATLATGDQSLISPDVSANMRVAGLPHLLVVSGLHMTIVCGVIFAIVRLVLTAIALPARRLNSKKAAAGTALLLGGLYVWLVGFPLAAIRAYIMIVIYLGGMLLDRPPDALRSLGIAAILLFLFLPSSLLDPGFQLSFAAVLALVNFYRWLGARRERTMEENERWSRRILRYAIDGVMTTLVATIATLPIIVYHFHSFGTYGVIANFLAVPLTSFYVAPLMIVALPAQWIGLDGALLKLASYGILGMIRIAAWVAGLPHATIHVPPIGQAAALLTLCGGMSILLRDRWAKALGLAIVLLGLSSAWRQPTPDLLVSSDGLALAIRQAERWELLKGSPRQFAVKEWNEALDIPFEKIAESAGKCDWQGCVYPVGETALAVPKYPSAAATDCTMSALVVMPEDTGNQHCAAPMIDKAAILRHGSYAGYLQKDGWRLVTGCESAGERPWSRCGGMSAPY